MSNHSSAALSSIRWHLQLQQTEQTLTARQADLSAQAKRLRELDSQLADLHGLVGKERRELQVR